MVSSIDYKSAYYYDFWRSCDTEYLIIILLQLKYIFDFNMYFNCINISHTKKKISIFDQINAALMSKINFFKKNRTNHKLLSGSVYQRNYWLVICIAKNKFKDDFLNIQMFSAVKLVSSGDWPFWLVLCSRVTYGSYLASSRSRRYRGRTRCRRWAVPPTS